ncbi:MAG: lactate utilization protein [Alphaproteobacteria bacterium]|nr:lactate utilization protein [Alphaproteobacteria bacterium]
MNGDSREAVLGALRRATQRDSNTAAAAAVKERLAGHARNTVPARGQLDRDGMLDLFVEQAEAVDATVTLVSRPSGVPGAVADYLRGENLPTRLRMAPDPKLDAYPWDESPLLEIERGKGEASDMVAVTGAFAAIAETGTLMLLSGPDSPTTLNFLPDAHIVVVRAAEMVACYEDGWDRLRATGRMPRCVNFITGPSRSADIEQTLQLGAHGPRWLHIVLVAGDSDG